MGAVSVHRGHVRFALSKNGRRGVIVGLGRKGNTFPIANLGVFEKKHNVDGNQTYGFKNLSDSCAEQLPPDFGPPTYKGLVETHPYASLQVGRTTYIADAAANAIFGISRSGRISTVAVLPPTTVKITASAAEHLGMPECVGGERYGFEPVPTDVEQGPDGFSLREHAPRRSRGPEPGRQRPGLPRQPAHRQGRRRSWTDWVRRRVSRSPATGTSSLPSSSAAGSAGPCPGQIEAAHVPRRTTAGRRRADQPGHVGHRQRPAGRGHGTARRGRARTPLSQRTRATSAGRPGRWAVRSCVSPAGSGLDLRRLLRRRQSRSRSCAASPSRRQARSSGARRRRRRPRSGRGRGCRRGRAGG